MTVVKAVAEGMLHIRMRSALQLAVEEQAPLHTTSSGLVMLRVAEERGLVMAATAVATEPIEPPEEPVAAPVRKPGVLVAWPLQLSARLRRVKEAITPSNAEVLQLFQSANRP